MKIGENASSSKHFSLMTCKYNWYKCFLESFVAVLTNKYAQKLPTENITSLEKGKRGSKNC
jgi:hypothetical protein